jgi:rubrerythrin
VSVQQHTSEPLIFDSPLLHFRCADCGYGASCRTAPARCPMCTGEHWNYADWRPFGSRTADAPLLRDLG